MLGDSEAGAATLQGLKSAEGFIRRQLARTLNLRNTPVITFVLDQSIEYGVNMSHKIAEVMAKDNGAEQEFDEDFEDDADFDEEDFDDDEFEEDEDFEEEDEE